MNNDKELRELWCGIAAGEKPMKPEELLLNAKRRTAEFDRTIRRRNLREIGAALLVAAFFGWGAYRADAPLARTGNLVISLSMVWVIGYLVRFGSASNAPDASADAETYRHALVERYDRQIRLLSNVKYWYLLPPYVGLLLLFASSFKGPGHPAWAAYIAPVLVTAVYAGIWYLNEVYAVGRLRADRESLLRLYGAQAGK